MELTFDDIRPFLSERGVLEIDLATQRAAVAHLSNELAVARAVPDEGTN